MTTNLTLTFPDLPNMALSGNSKTRLFWAARSRAAQEDLERWGWVFKTRIGTWRPWIAANPPPYFLTWEVWFPGHGNRDSDSVLSALKHAQDALVDVGIIPNDDNAVIPQVTIRVTLGSREPGTRLILERR